MSLDPVGPPNRGHLGHISLEPQFTPLTTGVATEVADHRRSWPVRLRASTRAIIGWLALSSSRALGRSYSIINSSHSTNSWERRKIGMKVQTAFLCCLNNSRCLFVTGYLRMCRRRERSSVTSNGSVSSFLSMGPLMALTENTQEFP